MNLVVFRRNRAGSDVSSEGISVEESVDGTGRPGDGVPNPLTGVVRTKSILVGLVSGKEHGGFLFGLV